MNYLNNGVLNIKQLLNDTTHIAKGKNSRQ